ncbi:MAG: fumarate hydratase [Endomicrobiales bacterium]|nr:fumarate hydratase [Endomicrobiales bacterium]
MRQIKTDKISETISRLCRQSNYFLPEDVWRALKESYKKESNENARWTLGQILENATLAGQKEIALCQDTGNLEVFVKIGQEVQVVGGNLKDAINNGVSNGYKEGNLRKSIVADPLFDRKNTGDNTPAQIYYEMVSGDKLEITVLPKGAGSENSSALKMLIPSDGWQGIKNFILDTVKEKAGSSCAPLIVGVGIGGTFSSVSMLAKKALLREVGVNSGNPYYAEREKELLEAINKTGIGPMGTGGKTTALAANIETAPCHIGSLPVAVSMQCHSCRRLTETI